MSPNPDTSAESSSLPVEVELAVEQTITPAPLSPEEMDCYECLACGYSYEPAKGDNVAKIAAGIAFEELPINWRCPVCSAPKKQFTNIDLKSTRLNSSHTVISYAVFCLKKKTLQ